MNTNFKTIQCKALRSWSFDLLKLKAKRKLGYYNRDRNIALFHIGRCGSTVPAHQLAQLDSMHWAGEIFERVRQGKCREANWADDAVELIAFIMCHTRCRNFGFETKAYRQAHLRPSLINSNPEAYVKALKDLGFTHFIHLTRRNLLRWVISLQKAHIENRWHHTKLPEDSLKFKLDVKEVNFGTERLPLLETLDVMERNHQQIRECLEAENALFLNYEAHVQDDPRVGFTLICRFVDLPVIESEINLARGNAKPASELISNYEEVSELLMHGRHAWMLD